MAAHSVGHPGLPTIFIHGVYNRFDISKKKMEIQDTLNYCVSDVVYTVKDNPNKWMSATCSINRHDRICYKTEMVI